MNTSLNSCFAALGKGLPTAGNIASPVSSPASGTTEMASCTGSFGSLLQTLQTGAGGGPKAALQFPAPVSPPTSQPAQTAQVPADKNVLCSEEGLAQMPERALEANTFAAFLPTTPGPALVSASQQLSGSKDLPSVFSRRNGQDKPLAQNEGNLSQGTEDDAARVRDPGALAEATDAQDEACDAGSTPVPVMSSPVATGDAPNASLQSCAQAAVAASTSVASVEKSSEHSATAASEAGGAVRGTEPAAAAGNTAQQSAPQAATGAATERRWSGQGIEKVRNRAQAEGSASHAAFLREQAPGAVGRSLSSPVQPLRASVQSTPTASVPSPNDLGEPASVSAPAKPGTALDPDTLSQSEPPARSGVRATQAAQPLTKETTTPALSTTSTPSPELHAASARVMLGEACQPASGRKPVGDGKLRATSEAGPGTGMPAAAAAVPAEQSGPAAQVNAFAGRGLAQADEASAGTPGRALERGFSVAAKGQENSAPQRPVLSGKHSTQFEKISQLTDKKEEAGLEKGVGIADAKTPFVMPNHTHSKSSPDGASSVALATEWLQEGLAKLASGELASAGHTVRGHESQAEQLVARVEKAVESLNNRPDRIVRFNLGEGSDAQLSVSLQLRDGIIHTTFVAANDDLRQVIARDWTHSLAATLGGEGASRVAEPVFSTPDRGDSQGNAGSGANADAQGQHREQLQGQNAARQSSPYSSQTSRQAQPERAEAAPATVAIPETGARILHAVA